MVNTGNKKRIGIIVLFSTVIVALSFGVALLFSNLHNDKLNNEYRNALLTQLNDRAGEYDENVIVLADTNRAAATELAQRLDANLRITKDGSFATLTLPDGVTILDVCRDDEYVDSIRAFSPDYQVELSEIEPSTATGRVPMPPQYEVRDGSFALQTYLDYLNLKNAWEYTRGGGVTVAVIDSGIDTDHPEFAGRISEYSYYASEDKVVKEHLLENGEYDWSLIEDENGHGTSVAGVIAADMNGGEVVGIAPEATLLVIKADVDEHGDFKNSSDLVFGIYYAIECDVNVINMSFGMEYSEDFDPFKQPAKLAYDSDVICVASAGNESTAALRSPACLPHVFGVGALADGSFEIAEYSNYGENVNIYAPGTVYTAYLDGGYCVTNGTSFSAPILSGVIALFAQQNRYTEFKVIEELLYASATDLGELGNDYVYAYGALDVGAFMLGERRTVTFDMLTDELDDISVTFIADIPLQNIPVPDRLYSIFDGWYYDIHCTEEYVWFEDAFADNLTLYANWVNEEDGIPYVYVELDDGTVEIREYTGHRRYITIPTYIDGKPVSSIGRGAFAGNTNLRSVTLPSLLVKIRESAFKDCSNLVSVNIPDTVKLIESNAFYGDIRMSSVSIGTSSQLESIGSEAFSNCARIRNFFIPKAVSSLSENAFLGCTNMQSFDVDAKNAVYCDIDGVLLNEAATELIVYPYGRAGEYCVPDSVRLIKTFAFRAAKVGYVDFNFTEKIEAAAFNQSKLISITFNEHLTYLGAAAFSECGSLYSVTFSTGLSEVPVQAFEKCVSLYAVELPSAVKVIESAAFSRCEKLRYLSFSSELTEIGSTAFSECYSLTRLEFPENSNLEVIGGSAFSETNIKKLDFPKSLKEIGGGAFKEVPVNSISFYMDGYLEIIGGGAFFKTDISNIVLPDSLISLGEGAFANTYISEVTIPRNVSQLGNAFYGCSNLTAVEVAEDNPHYNSIEGRVYTEDGTGFIIYPAGNRDNDYSVLPGVTYIGAYSFAEIFNLLNVTIPAGNEVIRTFAFLNSSIINARIGQGLKTIEENAFLFAEKLESINLPEGLTDVGEDAFFGTDSIISIIIPSSLTVLTEFSFRGCGTRRYSLPETLTEIQEGALSSNKNLASLDIPDSVRKIGEYAFSGSWALEKINLSENTSMARISLYAFANCGLKSFRMPSVISSIAQYAFVGCEYLESFTFAAGSKIPAITAYMFYGCSNLKSVRFEDGAMVTAVQAHGFEGMDRLESVDFGDAEITNIDNYAFRFCSSLKSLDLPDTLLSIGRYAFYGCKSFTELSVPRGVEFIGRYAFLGTNNCEIYFASSTLPELVAEDWDYGIKDYLLGVSDVVTTDEFRYAVLADGKIGILEYLGNKTLLDLTKYDFGGDVVNIGSGAFAFSSIESIVLPDTLVTVSARAFDSSALKEITIPASVTVIGREAFWGTPLERVNFAENSKLKNIEQSAFENTKKLKSVTIPASVSMLGRAVFMNSGIQSISFSNGSALTEIPENAFAYSALTRIVLPDNITEIGHNSFAYISTLVSVSFGTADVEIMSGAFYESGLSELYIPENVTYIGEYAFVSLKSLKEFKVSEENEYYASIGGLLVSKDGRKLIAAPAGMVGALELPRSIEVIGFGAFESTELSEIKFPADANILSLGYRAFFGASNINEITIPASVVAIDYYAFANCTSLESVIFAEDSALRGVYEGAFLGCRKLSDILLPDEIIEISDYAFYGCMQMQDVPISDSSELRGIYSYAFAYSGISGHFTAPKGLYDIGEYSFMGTRITKLTIPAEDSYDLVIGIGAFEGCNMLREAELPFIGASLDGEYGWFAYIFGAGAPEAGGVYVPETLVKVTFADGAENIAERAFYNLSGLQEVRLPLTVNTLHEMAFYGTEFRYSFEKPIITVVSDFRGEKYEITRNHFTKNLFGDLVIADGVTEINDGAFCGAGYSNNTSITSLTLPDSISVIEDYAFQSCGFIKDFKLPSRILEIGSHAFSKTPVNSFVNGEKLEYLVEENGVYYTKDMKHIAFFSPDFIGEYVLPSSIKALDEEQFFGVVGLTRVVLHSGITEVPKAAFAGCTSLTTVVFDGEITEIAESAFSGCINLKDFEMPEAITEIAPYAFSECINLKEIIIPEGVTKIGECAFYGDATIYDSVHTLYRYMTVDKLVLPSTLTEIGFDAFGFNARIYTIHNNSSLNLSIDSSEYGYVAYHTNKIINPDGSITYRDGYVEPTPVPQKELFYDENGFVFELVDGRYMLVDYVGAKGSVTLPLTFEGEEYGMSAVRLTGVAEVIFPEGMTKVPAGAFSRNFQLVSVVLPDSMNEIGAGAFYECTSLRRVDFGGVSVIGEGAFEYSGLYAADLTEGVTTLKSCAFAACVSLARVNLPSTLVSIGDSAFSFCKSISAVELPQGLKELSASAFSNCTYLSDFYVPDEFTDIESSLANVNVDAIRLSPTNPYFVIDSGALYSKDKSVIYAISSSFETFTVANTVKEIRCQLKVPEVYFEDGSQFTKIPKGIFNNTTVEKVVLPEGITEICDGAFVGGSGTRLSYVSLPDSLVSIGAGAFLECSELTSITLGKNVRNIASDAFNYAGFSTFEVDPQNKYFKTNGALLLNYSGDSVIMHAPAAVDFVIPNTVKELTSIFYSHWGYGDLSFEEGSRLYKIDNAAFQHMMFDRIELSEGLSKINTDAFAFARVNTLVLPSTLKEIERGFWQGNATVSVIYNNSELDISEKWRELIGDNTRIYDKNGNLIHGDFDDMLVTDDGFIYVIEGESIRVVGTVLQDEIITLPDSINGESYTCKWMYLNKVVRLPDSMVNVPSDFLMGSEINGVIIPASVETIGHDAFSKSTVESVVFEDGSRLTEIKSEAFSETGIKEIIIPESVKSINWRVFYRCYSLERVEIKSRNVSFDYAEFEECTYLREIVFDSNAQINLSDNMFRECKKLVSVDLPKNVENIGNAVFLGCSSLESLSIPSTVKEIGGSVLNGTKIFNTPDNWIDNVLIVDNYVFRVSTDAVYAIIPNNVYGYASGFTDSCYKLKALSLGGDLGGSAYAENSLRSLTNLETLIVTKMPSGYVANYFDGYFEGFGIPDIPITFKNLVLPSDTEIPYDLEGGILAGLENITVYVGDIEKNLRWDENFEGWSNGNKVVYRDKWIQAIFRDNNDEIMSIDVFRTSQVLRLPWADDYVDGSYRYVYAGFDVDSDGIPDSIPATSITDVYGKLVCTQELVCLRDGHTMITVNEALPTCTENGHSLYTYCKYCGLVSGYEEISATGHSYTEHIVPPTCTGNGAKLQICHCGDDHVAEELAPLGHDIVSVPEKAPTCEESGYTAYEYCSRCNYETVATVIEAKGHSYTNTVIVPPTCSAEGYTIHSCECGDSYTDTTVPQNGEHTWVENQVILPPMCESIGTVEYLCTGCQATKTDNAAPLGHSEGEWAVNVQATLDSSGEMVVLCIRCSMIMDRRSYELTDAEKFEYAVSLINTAHNANIIYSEIMTAMQYYELLDSEEKLSVTESYETLITRIEWYNAMCETVNSSKPQPMALAVAALLGIGFTTCGAWLVLKKFL